jgi:hypothetical protein
VQVNGQYSSWFRIRRGVRQGDPCSPYIYLICAEILSLLVRNAKGIKGITIKETEYLLSQFADDTAFCLDGSEQSFVECIKILDVFSDVSGLYINIEKTSVVWIGSMKNSNVRFMRDRNFCWDPGIFRYLGVKLTTDLKRIVDINYDGKLLEIQKIIENWKKRHLTPIGKIVVVKSLLVSKLLYLFMNLPDPPPQFIKDLERVLFNFVWGGKKCKISKMTMCSNYEEGGLKMINIRNFLASLKIGVLRRLLQDPSN